MATQLWGKVVVATPVIEDEIVFLKYIPRGRGEGEVRSRGGNGGVEERNEGEEDTQRRGRRGRRKRTNIT